KHSPRLHKRTLGRKTYPPLCEGRRRTSQLEIGGMSRLHIKDQTLRQIAHVSIGGSRVRIVLAHSLGTLPLRHGAAQGALRAQGASIVVGSNRVLTFGGIAQPVIPAGALAGE